MNTRPTGPWGLIMLNPVTPPYYLIIKHSENCALADHILCDSPPSPLKMPPWNPLGSSDFLSTSCPRILVWCLKINAAISCTTSWCQRIGFTAWRRVGPQVWFGNSSKKIKKKKTKAVLVNIGQITDYAKYLHIHSFFYLRSNSILGQEEICFRNPLTFPDL